MVINVNNLQIRYITLNYLFIAYDEFIRNILFLILHAWYCWCVLYDEKYGNKVGTLVIVLHSSIYSHQCSYV